MKLLVIAPRLSPDYNPEAICTTNFLTALSAHVEEIRVITSTKQSDLSPIGNITTHFVPDYEGESKFDRILRFLDRYPEDGYSWARRAAPLVKKLATSVDLIYSRGLPFASHLTVHFAQPFGNTPWIAHFSDPWPQWPEEEFWIDKRGWRKQWHKKLSKTPSGFTFSTARVQNVCREKQWGDNKDTPCCVLPHIATEVSLTTTSPLSKDRYNFVHTGAFYGQRKPDVFLAAWLHCVQNVKGFAERFRFTHVGPRCEAVAKAVLASNGSIHQLGPVQPNAALAIQSDADILLLVENQTEAESIYLPSKFINYLQAGKPILALTPNNGTVSDYLPNGYPFKISPVNLQGLISILTRFEPDTGFIARGMLSHCLDNFRPDEICTTTLRFFRPFLTLPTSKRDRRE